MAKFTDYSDKILARIRHATTMSLTAIGIQAQAYATYLCTVDTGRLRASITYATSTYSGKGVYSDTKGHTYSDAVAQGTPEEGSVHIGTNVEYAPYVELGTRKMKAQPFLTPAIVDHQSEWEEIAEKYFGKI